MASIMEDTKNQFLLGGMHDPDLVAVTKETVHSAVAVCTVVLKDLHTLCGVTLTLTAGGQPLVSSFCRK